MALSDLLTPSYCEVGKLKIGGLGDPRQSKSGGTWRPPVKLDHFVITTLHRDEKGSLIPDAALLESLKDYRDADGKLRAIPVMFASNEPEEVMTSWYVWYVGKRLGGRGDGRTVTFHMDPKTGEPLQEPQQFKWHPDYLDMPDPKQKGKRLFKLFTSLNVMVASPAARWGGFYRFRTTSVISAQQLYGSLLHLRKLTGGILRGLVFRLVVRPLLVTPQETGKPSTVYVVHVEYMNSDLRQLQTAARESIELERGNMEAVRQLEAGYRQLVAAQVDDEPDDDLIAEEEPKALPAAGTGPTAEQLAEQAIDAAETADDLKTAWSAVSAENKAGRLPDDAYARLAKRKDEKKGTFPQPQPATQPPASEPADAPAVQGTPAVAEPPAPARAGRAIVDDILRRCTELGTTWGDFRAEHAEALGITGYRAQDLTPEQALKLVEILKAEKEQCDAEPAADTEEEPEPAAAG